MAHALVTFLLRSARRILFWTSSLGQGAPFLIQVSMWLIYSGVRRSFSLGGISYSSSSHLITVMRKDFFDFPEDEELADEFTTFENAVAGEEIEVPLDVFGIIAMAGGAF